MATDVDRRTSRAGKDSQARTRLARAAVVAAGLLDVSVAGDDAAIPLQDRPHVRAIAADRDPRNQLLPPRPG